MLLLPFQYKRSKYFLTAACLAAAALLTICTDLLFARFQNTRFYISESLLFSSFWLLFIPFGFMQLKVMHLKKSFPAWLLTALMMAALHLLIYPALVCILSSLFFSHTFGYQQTLQYALTEYSIKAVLIYGMLAPALFALQNKPSPSLSLHENTAAPEPVFATTILVTDAGNKKVPLVLAEVLYCSARSPYIAMHHPQKKYLLTATLRAMENMLNSNQFVRIHRSYIVNMMHVTEYQSRLNGDYDLTLADGTVLRVSRNYAAAFKTAFKAHHINPK